MSTWLVTNHCLKSFPKMSPDLPRSRNYRVNLLSSKQCPNSNKRLKHHSAQEITVDTWQVSETQETKPQVMSLVNSKNWIWTLVRLVPKPMVCAPRDRAPTSISTWGTWSLRARTELTVNPRLQNLDKNPNCLPGLQVFPIIPSPRPCCYLFLHTLAAVASFCCLATLGFYGLENSSSRLSHFDFSSFRSHQKCHLLREDFSGHHT